MPVGGALLERAQEWILQEIRKSDTLQSISSIEISPDDREPKSLSWTLEGDRFMAQVVLWDTGEFEEDFASVESGQVRTRSGRLTSLGGLETCLVTVRDWALRGL